MSPKLTILFHAIDAVGHLNATIGVAEALRDRGHRIVYAIQESSKGKLLKYGFEEQLIEDPARKKDENTSDHFAKILLDSGLISGKTPTEKHKTASTAALFDSILDAVKNSDPKLKVIVEQVKPDVIVIDNFFGNPALVYSGIPWVQIMSVNPLALFDDESLPPGGSGYSVSGDKSKWTQFRETQNLRRNSRWRAYNQWLVETGWPPVPVNKTFPNNSSMIIYGYPQELDYTDIITPDPKWFRVDSFIRLGEEEFSLPQNLLNKLGKLIYISMGSMGSVDVNMMKRIISILSKSPHRFIVSKGPLHDQFEVADNMWGDRYVPQTKILQLVDLVVTHGGNNTVTETLYFGKPMIVMPLFGDQYDNAQRVHEKGYGKRIDAHNCSEEELLEAIETLLADNELKQKLKVMSTGCRLQAV